MQPIYPDPEFPPSQFYILLAISTTLFGIAVSYLSSSKRNIEDIDRDILFFIAPFLVTWGHVTLTVLDMAFGEGGEWLWSRSDVIFHLIGLLFCFFLVIRFILMVSDQAMENLLSFQKG